MYMYVYTCIYIYIYIHRERERDNVDLASWHPQEKRSKCKASQRAACIGWASRHVNNLRFNNSLETYHDTWTGDRNVIEFESTIEMYTWSPLEDFRLFGPSPWKIVAATYEKNTSEQPSPCRKLSKRESCFGDRVY